MDEMDKKILSVLKKDARTQYNEIGKIVNLSAPAVHARVKKLESSKTILRHTIDISPEAVGRNLCVFLKITINGRTSREIARDFEKIKCIEECHSVAGEDCIMIKLRVSSTLEIASLIEQIREIKGVEKTLTVVVLETHFERGIQL